MTLLIITSSSQSTTWALTQWLLSHRAETPSSHIIDHYFKVAVQHFSYYTMYTLQPFWNSSLWWHYWSLLQGHSLAHQLLHYWYPLTFLKFLSVLTLLIITLRSQASTSAITPWLPTPLAKFLSVVTLLVITLRLHCSLPLLHRGHSPTLQKLHCLVTLLIITSRPQFSTSAITPWILFTQPLRSGRIRRKVNF